jgi:outer membrane lipoprotein LolB
MASAVLLAGCTTPPHYAASFAQSSHSWSGRLGLQVHDADAQAQSFSASFQLHGAPAAGQLDVFNPLGSQIAQLQWQTGQASLQQGSHTTYSDSLDDLVQRSLGTALPIQALFAWLQGQDIAVPGWNVDLSRHASGRITAQRSMPLPAATLRIVLQQPD